MLTTCRPRPFIRATTSARSGVRSLSWLPRFTTVGARGGQGGQKRPVHRGVRTLGHDVALFEDVAIDGDDMWNGMRPDLVFEGRQKVGRPLIGGMKVRYGQNPADDRASLQARQPRRGRPLRRRTAEADDGKARSGPCLLQAMSGKARSITHARTEFRTGKAPVQCDPPMIRPFEDRLSQSCGRVFKCSRNRTRSPLAVETAKL